MNDSLEGQRTGAVVGECLDGELQAPAFERRGTSSGEARCAEQKLAGYVGDEWQRHNNTLSRVEQRRDSAQWASNGCEERERERELGEEERVIRLQFIEGERRVLGRGNNGRHQLH
jgi:hypothetical protein